MEEPLPWSVDGVAIASAQIRRAAHVDAVKQLLIDITLSLVRMAREDSCDFEVTTQTDEPKAVVMNVTHKLRAGGWDVQLQPATKWKVVGDKSVMYTEWTMRIRVKL